MDAWELVTDPKEIHAGATLSSKKCATCGRNHHAFLIIAKSADFCICTACKVYVNEWHEGWVTTMICLGTEDKVPAKVSCFNQAIRERRLYKLVVRDDTTIEKHVTLVKEDVE